MVVRSKIILIVDSCRYGVSMDDLVKWNKIKNYTIHPGQVLTIQTIVSTPAKPAITT
ncbi:LysM peptidoglycan-binding domain-containing protein, partial [Enterococcus gallinarum]|nr:LysM peptidoglycan-binding domain-containing protein [Enterococcus gallinarum]